jgi:hypothetical protein
VRPRVVAQPGALQEKIGDKTAHEEAGQEEPPAQQDRALFWDYSDRSSSDLALGIDFTSRGSNLTLRGPQ